MRNFLNTTFKFLSRSLLVTVLLFTSTSYVHADFLSECLVRHPGENTACGRCAEFSTTSGQTQCEAREFPSVGTGTTSSDLSWTQIQSCANNNLDTNSSAECQSIKKARIFTLIAQCSESYSVEEFGYFSTIFGYSDNLEFTFSPEYEQRCEADTSKITQCLSDQSFFENNKPNCEELFSQGDALIEEYKTKQEAVQEAASQAREVELLKAECAVNFFDPDCFKKFLLSIFDSTILPLFTGFLRLSSMIFEAVVYIGVVKFSDLVGAGSSSWITSIWGTIRDILNIGVIFVLLYAAINVIVGRGGEIKKLIAGVILFGVMTNFSLFLTKAAVDVANVVALEFYNQMRTEDSINTVSFDRGVGASIVEVTKLTKFYTAPDEDTGTGGGITAETKNANSGLRSSFLFRFAMIVVFIAVSFVFLQAAGIFIARTVSLIFLLIFSPLMFAGGIFAPLQKWISRWHEEFLGQTILAPIFFILLYVALTILSNVVGTLETLLDSLNKDGGDFFLSLCVILISSILVIFSFSFVINKTKEYAGSIGGKAAQWGNKLGGMALGGAGRLALGGTAAGLRSSANFLGAKRLANWAENSNSIGGSLARALQVDKLKNATFDVRNTKTGRKLGTGVSAALGAAGVDLSSVKLGEGSKTTLETQKTIPEVYNKFKKDFQDRADKRGERIVEQKLKEIEEEENSQGIRTDYSSFDRTLKTRDAAGNIQALQRGAESDEDWEKKIKKANQQNKSYIGTKKQEHLDSVPRLASDASLAVTPFGRRQLEAEYRARQKYKKQFKDSSETKLKTYTEGLKTDEYRNILGVTDAQIDAMDDDGRIALWQTLGKEADKEIKDIDSHLDPSPGPARDEQLARKQKWALLSNKAKNASKQIAELKKKIEAEKK